jgi:hypothetical protein
MESSNGANSVIAYGKGGEIASNRRDEQESPPEARLSHSARVPHHDRNRREDDS